MAAHTIDEIAQRVDLLAECMLARGETLAFAESCTGGLLSASVAAKAGVSKFFLGAVVSYHRKAKAEILEVPASLIDCVGEVSVPVARRMAQGVKKRLGSDWAVGVTGIAGPGGGSVEKPVGTVCFGIVGPGIEEALMHRFESQERSGIQQLSTLFALDLLINAMR